MARLILFCLIALGGAARADQTAVRVSGSDEISRSNATDCSFVAQPHDDLLLVGVQSESAGYVDTLIRLPKTALPLADGFKFKDELGHDVSYAGGVLTASIELGAGDGIGSGERTEMKITVDPRLTHASEASVTKKTGWLHLQTEASIACGF